MNKIFIYSFSFLLLSCSSTVNYQDLVGRTLLEYEKKYNLSAYRSEWKINPAPDQKSQEVRYFLDDGSLFFSIVGNPNYEGFDPSSDSFLVESAVFYESELSKEERYKIYRESQSKYINRYRKYKKKREPE